VKKSSIGRRVTLTFYSIFLPLLQKRRPKSSKKKKNSKGKDLVKLITKSKGNYWGEEEG
jgi:hypothetical protein